MDDQSTLTIKGIGAAPGIAIGKAYLVERGRVQIPRYRLFGDEAVADECMRFEEAVAKAESDLEAIKNSIRYEFRDHARLLEVQQMILRDPSIYDESLRYIRKERSNAQLAIMKALRKARELFSGLNDEYARSRIADVNAAGNRVIRILAGQDSSNLEDIRERAIIITHDLSPADAIQLQVGRTMGVVTEIGGSTSHTSIVARSLNIPAVVGAENAARLIATGDILIIDGGTGTIVVNPSESDLRFYYERQDELEAYDSDALNTDKADVERRAQQHQQCCDPLANKIGDNVSFCPLHRAIVNVLIHREFSATAFRFHRSRSP